MKTKRVLIISSAIMALVLVVTIVSVSAAWFGDIKHAETSRQLYVSSARPEGKATIDIESAADLNRNTASLVPAKAVNGWLLGGSSIATGATLRTANSSAGIQTAATVADIYFPFGYSGAADAGYVDGKRAIKIYFDSTYIKVKGTTDTVDKSINFIDEFHINFYVVTAILDLEGHVVGYNDPVASATATKDSSNKITYTGLAPSDDNIFFVEVLNEKALYMLVTPYSNVQYYVKASISYNYVDEELNPATINQTLMFGIRIKTLNREDEFEPAVLPYISPGA